MEMLVVYCAVVSLSDTNNGKFKSVAFQHIMA